MNIISLPHRHRPFWHRLDGNCLCLPAHTHSHTGACIYVCILFVLCACVCVCVHMSFVIHLCLNKQATQVCIPFTHARRTWVHAANETVACHNQKNNLCNSLTYVHCIQTHTGARAAKEPGCTPQTKQCGASCKSCSHSRPTHSGGEGKGVLLLCVCVCVHHAKAAVIHDPLTQEGKANLN